MGFSHCWFQAVRGQTWLTQPGGGPEEAAGSCRHTAADGGLHPTDWFVGCHGNTLVCLRGGSAETSVPPGHWDRRGQHPPAGQSSSSHNPQTLGQKRTASTSWTEQLKSQSPDIRTEEDSIHQLDTAAQVTIFRLRTGHCQLLSHLHRPKMFHSDKCPCGTGPQTHNHILQSCLTFQTPDMAQSGGGPQEALGAG